MTISTTTVRIAYDGDNVTATFAVPFPFFAASELEVIERDVALGTETPKVLGTHYTVAGGDGATGTVTASAPPSSAVQWVVRRKTARTQTTDYTPNDPFPAETHEKALDRLTMIGQELGEESDRAMTFPKTDAIDLSPTLPASVARAGRVLAFDGAGVPAVSAKTLAQLESEADNAAASAATAASSASAASSSATAAATSATGAATSAASAATSATAAGASAVISASVAEKNVKSYGAVGDGITDDTAAFTAAIAAAAGGVLTVPEGTFIVTGITIDVPLELRMRTGATIKQKANTAGNLITVSHSDVTIRGGTLDGNRANQTTSNAAILSNAHDRIVIDGVTISDTKGCGTHLIDGDDLIVRNSRFSGTVQTSVQFFCTAKNVHRAVAENNVIDRSDDATYNDGCVKMTNNSGGTTYGFIGCSIHNNRAAMSVTPTGTNVVVYEIWAAGLLANHSCSVTDNYSYGGSFAYSLNGCIASLIESNEAYNFRGLGFELADCVNSGIVGNTGDGAGNGGDGAAINNDASTSKNNRIVGNALRQCVRAIYVEAPNCSINDNEIYENTHEGIEINGPGNDGALIVGNQILTTTQSASFAGIVNVNNSDVVIVGNSVDGVGNGIQLLGTTGTVDRLTVLGNTTRSSSANSIVFTGANFGSQIANGPNAGAPIGAAKVAMFFGAAGLLGYASGTPSEDVGGSLGVVAAMGVGATAWVKEAAGSSGWKAIQCIYANTTANRPGSLASARAGFAYFDTTLGKEIWWNGSAWVQANGLPPKGASLEGSATYDAPSISAGGTTTTSVTVTGAALGDYVQASFSVDLQGMISTAYVSSANTIMVVLFNPTASAIDLASTVLHVRVTKQ